MSQNPGLSKDDAFFKVKKASIYEYETQLSELIKDTKNVQNNEVRIIFLDKNHPANVLEKTNKSIDL